MSHDIEYFQHERRLSRPFLAEAPNMTGQRVLELGCGFGGMLAVLSELGASATGIDIDDRRAQFARSQGFEVLTVDAATLPFPEETFDVVVTYATIEHIHDLRSALAESFRVLRCGGIFYGLWGPSWLTYNGPHLIKCLSVPWAHLFFSDRTVIAALEEQKRQGRWPTSYLNYKMSDFRSMGRTTRRRLRREARGVGFVIEQETSRSPRRWKDFLARLPLLDELLAGELTIMLRKP
jgi:SAM-dependent methyltransferase